ncbi:MAG: hypothetical protein ACI9R3_004189 [Verrucomicrobiales bacterium]
MVIYQDGTEAVRVPYSGILIASEIPGLGIGVKTDDSGEFPDGGNPGFWDGMIDDLGLWGRALTPAEITAVYQAGLSGISLDKASLTSSPSVDPGLTIEESGGNVILSWSASEDGWVLKSTADLPAGDWQDVPGDVVSENGRNKATVTPALSSQWFRLERP